MAFRYPTIDDYSRALTELREKERAFVRLAGQDAMYAHLIAQQTESQTAQDERNIRMWLGMQNVANLK